MKKILLFSIAYFPLLMALIAQETIQKYKGKTYIFDAFENVKETNSLGDVNGNDITALKGSLFYVVRIKNDNQLVIEFLDWEKKKDPLKRETYNYATTFSINTETNKQIKVESNKKYFLLEKSTFQNSCSEYIISQRWEIAFGTLTTPFKFRHSPAIFTTNLNLGASVSFQWKFYNNWSAGAVAGLSLSYVILDSFSTKGVVKLSTERPAVTPSLSAVFGYKNINLTIGLGWDIINKISNQEKSWAYNGNRWVGVGLGIKLFSENDPKETTTPQSGQK